METNTTHTWLAAYVNTLSKRATSQETADKICELNVPVDSQQALLRCLCLSGVSYLLDICYGGPGHGLLIRVSDILASQEPADPEDVRRIVDDINAAIVAYEETNTLQTYTYALRSAVKYLRAFLGDNYPLAPGVSHTTFISAAEALFASQAHRVTKSQREATSRALADSVLSRLLEVAEALACTQNERGKNNSDTQPKETAC